MVEVHRPAERSIVYKMIADLVKPSGVASYRKAFPCPHGGEPESIVIAKVDFSDKFRIELRYNSLHGGLDASAMMRPNGELCDSHGLFSIQALNRLLAKCYEGRTASSTSTVATEM